MIVFAVIGLSFVLLGPNWPWLKSRLPRRFAASITRVGSNFRWWLVVLLLGFVYLITGQWQLGHLEVIPPDSPSTALATPLPEFAKYSNAGDGWPKLPLSDGEKWHFAQWMKAAGAPDSTKPHGCTIVFVRYEQPPAEDLVSALGEVLNLAGWKYKDTVALANFPKGVGVLSNKPNDNCATSFVNGLRQFAGIQVLGYPYKQGANYPGCDEDCIVVQIGNVPN